MSPSAPEPPSSKASRPTLIVDYTLYEHYLANSDLSDTDKHEFIETLFNLIAEFVMLGWQVHPLQQIPGQQIPEKSCGQEAGRGENRSAPQPDMVDSGHQLLSGNFIASTGAQAPAGKRASRHGAPS